MTAKTEYPDVPLLGELNFEVSVCDKKYAYRFYTDGKSELIRKGVPWDERPCTGDGLLLAMAQEIDGLRDRKGAEPRPARAIAQLALDEAKVGRDTEGVALLPIPADRVLNIAARAVTIDRDRGSISFATIARKVMESHGCGEAAPSGSIHNMIVAALNYAQASGARFSVPTTIGEDDYTEAVSAACEAFATVLKDKGLVA